MTETSIIECCKANIPSQCRFEQSVWFHEARYKLANYTKLQAITLYKLASKACYFNWTSVESTRMKQIYLERKEKRNYKAQMESIRTCVTKYMMVSEIDTHVCSRLVEGVYLCKASLAIAKLHDLFRNFTMIQDLLPKYDFAKLALTNSKWACILYVHEQKFTKFKASRVVLLRENCFYQDM